MNVIISCIEDNIKSESVYLNEETQIFSKCNEKYRVLLNNFFESNSFKDSNVYLKMMHSKIITKLTPFYNSYVGVNERKDYWEIVLGYFIHKYIYLLYPKFLYVKAVDPDSKILCRVHDHKIYIKSIRTFWKHVLTDPLFHENLYAQLVTLLDYKQRSFGQEIKIKFKEVEDERHKNAKDIILKKNIVYGLPFSRLSKICLNALGCRLSLPRLEEGYFCERSYTPSKDADLRSNLSKLDGDDLFESIIYRTLSMNMPSALLEKIPTYIRSAQVIAERNKPKRIISGQGLFFDPSFGCFVAESLKLGTKFYMARHGGVANDYIEPEEWYEKKNSDGFITHGGKCEDEISLGLITRVFYRYKILSILPKKKYPVLVIGTEESPFITRLIDQIFGYRMNEYVDYKIKLFKLLAKFYGKSITHRGYHKAYSLSDVRGKIDRNFPDLNHAHIGEHIQKQIALSELVIFDYLGPTSLRDSLSLNIPSMVVFNPDINAVSPKFKKWIERLISIGIYHLDLESLNSTLEEIHLLGSAKKWWNEPRRKAVINEFKQEYNLNLRGMKLWKSFFKS